MRCRIASLGLGFLCIAACAAAGMAADETAPAREDEKKAAEPAKKDAEAPPARRDTEPAPAARKQENKVQEDWDQPAGPGTTPAATAKPAAETERDILYQLDRRISVDYVETELQDIIRDLAAQTGINMVLDTGVEREKQVSLQVKDMPVYKVLRWVADLSGYYVTYRNEAVLITGKKDTHVITMVYPIADLLRPAKSYYPPGTDEEDEEEEEDEGDSREKILEVIRKVCETDKGE